MCCCRAGPSGANGTSNGAQKTGLKLSKEEEALFDEDDLSDDELDQLEASLMNAHVE